jgi:hypothetical protein
VQLAERRPALAINNGGAIIAADPFAADDVAGGAQLCGEPVRRPMR